MPAILYSLGTFIVDLFKPRRRLEAENLFLRHQLSIALRRAPPRLRLHSGDRALLKVHAAARATATPWRFRSLRSPSVRMSTAAIRHSAPAAKNAGRSLRSTVRDTPA